MPLLKILAEMETVGIRVNRSVLHALDQELTIVEDRLVKAIYKDAGTSFNLNSPKQLAEVLFQKLKLVSPSDRPTKSGSLSTNAEILTALQEQHPIVARILEYRELFKLQSTYVRPLQELVGDDQRIHTDYVQTGTATGRISSQNPNLQNIPIGTEWAVKLRSAFIAESGYEFVSFDYSQIELRILASLVEDVKMIEAFHNNIDIHRLTAANVFNVALDKVTPEMRRVGKTLNFGVIYGMGAIAFAKTSGLSFKEARQFIDEYFEDFKNIKTWQEEVKAKARKDKFVTNLNHRRRWVRAINVPNSRVAADAERAAINMPVQGLAADIIKQAMISVAEEFRRRGWWQKDARLLLTIHDELLFEIKRPIINEAIPIIRHIMESAFRLKVPLKVSTKIGSTWGALRDIS